MTYSSSDFVNDVTEALCDGCHTRDDNCDDLESVALCVIGAIEKAIEVGY